MANKTRLAIGNINRNRLMKKHIINSLLESEKALSELIKNKKAINSLEEAAKLIVNTFRNSNKVLTCGNGGSMCDAIHFAEELTGRFRSNRPSLPALAISDAGHISCVSNDYGYEYIFSRYKIAIYLYIAI